MYKAIFELSPTRADFVAHLFSRPLPRLSATVTPADLFAAVANAPMSDSAFEATRFAIIDRLTVAHGFALTPDDLRSINHVYAAFFEAGPDINYGYRASMRFGPTYVTFAQLQNLTNADGVNMAFLATEESYRVVRAMHAKNLIVPVVGDFAGPKAIRGVGEYLKQRGASVGAFYLSNVEQYLFRNFGDAERFYRNVETLPVDSTSSFIRSVPNGILGAGLQMFGGSSITTSILGGPSKSYSVRVVDSGGVNVIWTTVDSGGKSVTTRTVDSSQARATALDIFRSLRARDDSAFRARFDSAQRASGGGTTVFGRDTVPALGGPLRSVVVGGAGSLASGLASIRASLEAFNAGRLRLYEDVTLMTKTSGWK